MKPSALSARRTMPSSSWFQTTVVRIKKDVAETWFVVLQRVLRLLWLLLPLDDQHHFGDGSVVHMWEDAEIFYFKLN